MAHPFDESVDAIRRAIMAADGRLPVGEVAVRGAVYPAFLTAPPDLPRFFATFCALHADKPALVDGADRLSFGEAYGLARSFAHGLIRRHDVMPGDRIALAARNGAGWVIAYMGIALAGGVATLVNGFWTGREMADAIEQTGCRLILADRPRLMAIRAAGAGEECQLLDLDAPLADALAELQAEADGSALPEPGPDAPATILFTSGSTGSCKGALSDQRAKVQAALHFACSTLAVLGLLQAHGASPRFAPAILMNLPLFHVTAEVTMLLHSFVIGRKMVMLGRWQPLEALRLIEAERITYFTGVPLMGMDLATHPRRHEFDLSSLADVAAGGAPRPADQAARVRAGLPGVWPAYGYGLTETNALGTGIIHDACLDRPATPGKSTPPLADIAIFDAAGGQLGPGEVGEIGIRSVAAISGYWNAPGETAALFAASGHVLTGDLGYLDAEGYLFIVDRRKDIIIRGGENIASTTIESALHGLPGVVECAAFGVPDERMGEVPVAIVRLSGDSGETAASLMAGLVERLAPFERPVEIQVWSEPLPRLGSEKIDKRALRAAWLSGQDGSAHAVATNMEWKSAASTPTASPS
jgi:acyl-CoA synthetase (AMP-forming)/AMP-acid ligase II